MSQTVHSGEQGIGALSGNYICCSFFYKIRIGRTIVCTNFCQEAFLFQKLAIASKESSLKDFPQEWLHTGLKWSWHASKKQQKALGIML